MIRVAASLVVLAALALPAAAPAKTSWLCRPGMAANPCTVSTAASVVSASGATSTEPAAKAGPRPIDCFYVYPTVSAAPGISAPVASTPAIRAVATIQASRYGAVCRVFAPLYPQVTEGGLRMFGAAQKAAVAKAYAGVRDAWRDYLAHDNHGRGILLIGHSQGSGMLTQLITKEIDPSARERRLLVAAHLMGGDVTVRDGSDRGGDFRNIPACARGTQTGCVVAYSSYLNTPPTPTIFGRVPSAFKLIFGGVESAGTHVLCTDVSRLAGSGGTLQPYFRMGDSWVTYPGRYRASCRSDVDDNRLQVTPTGGTSDTRPVVSEQLGPTWGLHLVDVNIALGELVKLAGREVASYTTQR